MEVAEIKMERHVARRAFVTYAREVQKTREARVNQAKADITTAGRAFREARARRDQIAKEDIVLMETYRALSLGKRIINLRQTLTTAGVDEKFRPLLAVGRADWTTCFFNASHHDRTWFSSSPIQWQKPNKREAISFPHGTFPRETWDWRRRQELKIETSLQAKAIVPSIPAPLRPALSLDKYHILWEAVWEPVPPVDPFLLKHVAGDHYAIVAQWDLTPLERSVLAGRLT
jgi:hypothetical protein